MLLQITQTLADIASDIKYNPNLFLLKLNHGGPDVCLELNPEFNQTLWF